MANILLWKQTTLKLDNSEFLKEQCDSKYQTRRGRCYSDSHEVCKRSCEKIMHIHLDKDQPLYRNVKTQLKVEFCYCFYPG